jgi:hypothetical protein
MWLHKGAVSAPHGLHLLGVAFMKLVHFCYVALGFAVARWIFKREPMSMADPVPHLRSSGLL